MQARVEALELGLDEPGDLFEALGERGDAHLGPADAIVEVLAEAAGRDLGAQVLEGGDADADVDLAGARGAELHHFMLLEHAEQLRLDGEVEVAHLVEEQRAAVRGDDVALGVGIGAGEGAALRAEEEALGEPRRDGGAVDGDEWSLASGGDVVGAGGDAVGGDPRGGAPARR